MREIGKLGIETTALVMPVIPYLTDNPNMIRKILRLVRASRIDNINLWPLHLFDTYKKAMLVFISDNRPELISPFAELYRQGSVRDGYIADFTKLIAELRQEYGMFRSFKTRTEPKRVPTLFDISQGDEE